MVPLLADVVLPIREFSHVLITTKGIANTMSVNILNPTDKFAIKQLVDIINLGLCAPQYQVNARDLPHNQLLLDSQ